MADKTKIEWTRGDDGTPGATWNPITGCSVVSPGCKHCYAMRLAGGRMKHHPSRAGLTDDSKAGPVWNGRVRLNEDWLDQPLRWERPRRIFVCAHGDLFHERVPWHWIGAVFEIMRDAPRHTFQVLTKRPARAREFMRRAADGKGPATWLSEWPLPNVWLGVSVEDQARADERVPELLATPAAVRFVSCEPLLGAVDLSAVRHDFGGSSYMIASVLDGDDGFGLNAARNRLDWVICGGESGPGARPMHPDWVRALRDQCRAAHVAFHFKQWGEWAPLLPQWQGRGDWMILDHGGGLDIPDDRWPDEDAGETPLVRVGKARAGRLLDGRTWDEMPDTHGPAR